jgi:GNAT superfamily N-acetyltransferase
MTDSDAANAPQVEVALYRDVRGWLDLAAEVEWFFGDMLGSAGFYRALLHNIERGTAFCVREGGGPPGAPLLGGLLFSPARPDRPEYRIGWLSVAERSRRLGVGTALVRRVFELVVPPATLSVITFGEDIEPGRAARRFYERLGFRAAEAAPNGPEGGSRQVFRRAFPPPQRQPHAGGAAPPHPTTA